MRLFILLYGVISYAIFFVTFLYAIGFVNDLVVPKSVSSGEGGEMLPSILVNVAMLSLFAIQHTIMARPAFKKKFTQIIPEPMERSTFVLLTSLILALTFWQWRPMPEVIWSTDNAMLSNVLIGISLLGYGIVLYASFLINHFDLFGLRQSWLGFKGIEYTDVPFKVTALYKLVRHPLMLGFLIAFWATPNLTQAHLLFAVVTTGYIFFGITVEERDIAREHGEEFEEYRRNTAMILPIPKGGGRKSGSSK